MIPDYLRTPEHSADKIWGTLEKRESMWVMDGHPYMISMAKRLFPGSKGNGRGAASFPASKRIVGDLAWFMQRFPLDIKDNEYWLNDLAEAQKHFEVQESILKKPKKILPPPEFKGELMEFQKEGLSFLLHNPRSLLADQMGLGKTVCALSWLTSLKESPPYIAVVPPHLLRQWKSEIGKFLGEGTSVHIIKGLKQYSLPASDIYLIHYLLLRGWKNYLPKFGFTACIFDEIQELRRSESEKYSVASLLAESVDNVIGLSGTPVYNYGNEIYNILNILEYHCLGDYSSFTREWCTGYGSKMVADPKLLGDYLKEEGLLLRRLKEDVLSELPPKRRVIQNIDVDEGKFDELIAPVINQAKRISDIKDAFERGRETMTAIDSTRMITGIAKAHYVCAFVKTLMEVGETVILYGHHHAVMDIYMEELREYLPVMISGRQSVTVKDLSQKAFMDGDTDLIIVSLRSGLGLNLQRARCVVFGELDWSPAALSQCEDRCHRLGQKDSVLCYYLTCGAGTDQHMLETLGLKTSQFVNIMGDRPETEKDKMLAQVDTKKHMNKVIELLQHGGRRKEEPDAETVEKLRKLEKMPVSKEPTSLDDFYDKMD